MRAGGREGEERSVEGKRERGRSGRGRGEGRGEGGGEGDREREKWQKRRGGEGQMAKEREGDHESAVYSSPSGFRVAPPQPLP